MMMNAENETSVARPREAISSVWRLRWSSRMGAAGRRATPYISCEGECLLVYVHLEKLRTNQESCGGSSRRFLEQTTSPLPRSTAPQHRSWWTFSITGSTTSETRPVVPGLRKRLPPATSSLDSSRAYAVDEVGRMIRSTKPESCSLDPVPTLILMEFLDIVLPFITVTCNKSLQEGRLPSSQRHAIVTPILKKTGLDAGNVVNYRPISNLTVCCPA